MTTLAQRLSSLRTQKGISCAVLAQTLGFPRLSIEKIEAGKLTPPREQQEKLAAYFGVTLPYLRGETDDLVSMESWFNGNIPEEPTPTVTVKPQSKAQVRNDAQQREDGAIFQLLLKSEAFQTAVLAVLKSPEGQKLIAEAMKKGR